MAHFFLDVLLLKVPFGKGLHLLLTPLFVLALRVFSNGLVRLPTPRPALPGMGGRLISEESFDGSVLFVALGEEVVEVAHSWSRSYYL